LTAVVIEDHVLFRSGLLRLLENAGIRVVGEASTAEAAFDLVQRQAPDVVLVDLGLPRMSGHDAIRHLRRIAPASQVLVLTISADENDVIAAVLAGACGYLLKDARAEDIVAGVRAAAAGESMVSPRMASVLFEQLRHAKDGAGSADGVHLSARERDVLRLIVDGKDNAEIAEALVISPSTVKHHISHILLKLGVDSRLQAAVRAVRDSLL
jgi:two-component system nitrate/nitrite response regulator NarL